MIYLHWQIGKNTYEWENFGLFFVEQQLVRRESLNLKTLSVFTFQYVSLYILIFWPKDMLTLFLRFKILAFLTKLCSRRKKRNK